MRKVLIITLLVCFLSPAFSQFSEAGFFAGGSFYNGDVNPGQPFLQTKAGYGAVYRHNFDTRLAARLGVYRGQISANEADIGIRPSRQAVFEGNVTDISLVGEFNFLKYFTGSTMHRITPFIFGGVGYHMSSGNYSTQIVSSKDYSSSSFSVPFGLGFKYSLAKNFGLSFEWGYRKTFNDKIDGLDSKYPKGSSLEDVQLSNASTNDWYSFAGLTLTLKLDIFKREVCRDLQRKQVRQ